MRKERVTVYLTERQRRQLERRSQGEGLPMAEIIRRAVDTYLAWDDPTYTPIPSPRTRNGHSTPE